MFMSDLENLRIRVTGQVNEGFAAFCKKRLISKQDAIEVLLEWFLRQQAQIQLLIIGRQDERYVGQIAEMVLQDIKKGLEQEAGLPDTPSVRSRPSGRMRG
jgi:hypothetical protein